MTGRFYAAEDGTLLHAGYFLHVQEIEAGCDLGFANSAGSPPITHRMMTARELLAQWVTEALEAHGGGGSPASVAKYIWDHHEAELRARGELFYTWQYEMRWAAQKLRDRGVLKSVRDRRTLTWELTGQ